MKYRSTIVPILLSTTLMTAAFAADVPEGTTLAPEQTFTYRVLDEFSSFDPQIVEDVNGSEVVRDLFEGLYNQNADGEIVPGVALSHTVSEDNMTYTFTLRQDAKWSDGKPVTAGDFVYAWQRAVDPATASPYAWYMELMSIQNGAAIIAGEKPITDLGVSAPDDHTLVVQLSQPLPYFAKMVSHATTFPAPKWAIEEHGKEWTRPGNLVSNGAYVLTEHVSKERSVRERNEMYWDNDKTVLDKVVTLVIGDEAQGLTRWRAGEVDKTDIPSGQYPALKDEFPEEAYALPRLCNYYMTFNLKDGPDAFQDVRVRQALSYALDRSLIVERVLQGGQFPAYTFTPGATDGFEIPEVDYANMTQAERDEKARELLAEAGYGPDGDKLSFTYLYNTSESHQQIAIIASQMWKQKLGVEVTLENQEWKVFLETRGNQNFELARGAWCGDYNEASTFLDLLTSQSGYNDGKFSNARVDELMAQAKSSQDTNPLYFEVEAILAEEMPVIPIYHYSTNMMLDGSIKGWPVNNVEQTWYSKDLYKVAE
ncbi:peptide ABC transporter substrate-binding protein [Mameliella sediminis]|uniref:peptide ABC transporter substrate-binding protein n=1 Tax=Mameliella sediminis TaxID=2836866 RepID=UPI001C48A53E|nr:peptide ABC transporter substrate-binding protein [Mameliella sediminis]MBY6116089.1 peptide ABC transporter substrate-binding protein [Antarctobacter heliothermus]MBY6146054.1 peptide ABC transporter substrate-binding protein [Mameliella alba]MBV7396952.1 peptide ABC transporter substrate-binding protein [Mameliella sediminis]MBY6161759.1 peptide ABC transporter substrate-binding protein [Mameliella alba]MBY6170229.1 peptide ABC transporter substrate-binding protein [Mameliella alba]